MSTYTLKGHITEDHRLEVDVPDDVRPGEAEVILTVKQAEHCTGAALLALFKQWDQDPLPGTPRSKEQIDAELNAMRDEWDRD